MATLHQMTSVPSRFVLDETNRVLQTGGVIALPTETFYALGASPFDATGVERIARIKGRADRKPILILIAQQDTLAKVAESVPKAAEILMQRFWPGPLTIVLPAARSMSAALTGGTGTIGVRRPSYPPLERLLRAVGPVTGTSANRSGVPAARTAGEVQQTLGDEIDLILDGGTTSGGLPSTVVSVVGTVRVLREGRIGREALIAALATVGIGLAGTDNT
jgi:L-threonylcarbamoyladenylate synthase